MKNAERFPAQRLRNVTGNKIVPTLPIFPVSIRTMSSLCHKQEKPQINIQIIPTTHFYWTIIILYFTSVLTVLLTFQTDGALTIHTTVLYYP